MAKTLIMKGFGGPEVLEIADLDPPKLQPGELLLKTLACGINPIDAKIRRGTNFICRKRRGDPFPWTLGFDICGVVEDPGTQTRFKKGDRVFGFAGDPFHPDGCASEAAAFAERLCKVPKRGDPLIFAALPIAGSTALTILEYLDPNQPRVMVSGATGGVGHLLVQILCARGFEVTALSSPKSAEYALECGAVAVYDYHEGLPPKLWQYFDAVVDMRGGSYGISLYNCVKPGGVLLTVPTITAIQVISAAPHGIEAIGIKSRNSAEHLKILAEMVKNGSLKPRLAEVMQLDQAAEAHRIIEEGHTMGKIVLVP